MRGDARIFAGPGGGIMDKSAYRNSWIAEKLDRINLTVPKGKKEIIKAAAEKNGESVNAFINRAIDAQLGAETPTQE